MQAATNTIGDGTAVKAVMNYVQMGIQTGQFTDGKLPIESDVAKAVGVSRTPVREAMKILDAVGVIEIRRGIGTFVRPQAASALNHLIMFQTVTKTATTKQLFETRMMVEKTAAEMVAAKGSPADIALIRAANQRFHDIAVQDDPDLDAATTADIEFHKIVFGLCGNPLIAALGSLVVEQCRPWIRESHEVDGPMITYNLHESLIQGIENWTAGSSPKAPLSVAVQAALDSWKDRLDRG